MSSSVTPVRIAVLGLSDFLRRYAFPGLATATGCEFVGVAGRNPEKLRHSLGEAFPGIIYSSYDAALEDPNVEAVYITLPNATHTEWTLKAVAAGKHVLCEKPLSPDPADVDSIEIAARTANLIVTEGLMYRFHPQWTALVDLLRSDAIGQVRTLVSTYAYIDPSLSGPRFDPALGGGALKMVGCYAIDISVMAFKDDLSAVTALSRAAGNTGVDATTSAVLEFGNGHAVLTASTESFDNQYVRIIGESGMIEVPLPINATATDTTSITVTGNNATPDQLRFEPADQFKLEFEHFARAVRGLVKVAIPLKESRQYAVALNAVARSAQSQGTRIRLDPNDFHGNPTS